MCDGVSLVAEIAERKKNLFSLFFFFSCNFQVTSVDKCDDCEPAKCKTAFATECTNAETVSSSCKDGGANQFDCTLEQSIDAYVSVLCFAIGILTFDAASSALA